MKEYKVTYSNDYLNIICIEYIEADTKKQARDMFNNEYKNLKYINIMEIEQI